MSDNERFLREWDELWREYWRRSEAGEDFLWRAFGGAGYMEQLRRSAERARWWREARAAA